MKMNIYTLGISAFLKGKELDPRSCSWEQALEMGTNRSGYKSVNGSYEMFLEAKKLFNEVLEKNHIYKLKEDDIKYHLAQCLHALSAYLDENDIELSTKKREDMLLKAEELYRNALNFKRKELGEEHPDTIDIWENIARCLLAQGGRVNFLRAEGVCRWVIGARNRVFRSSDPLTLAAKEQLQMCIRCQKEY